MDGVHHRQNLHHGLRRDVSFVPGQSHGAGNVGGELGNAEVRVPLVAGLSEVAEENHVRDVGVRKEVVGHPVDADFQPFGQRESVDGLFRFDQLPAEILVDIDYNRLVKVFFAAPVVVEGGDVDSDLLGDHAGRRAVKSVLAENPARDGQDAGLHRFRIFSGLLKGGGHRRLPACDSII